MSLFSVYGSQPDERIVCQKHLCCPFLRVMSEESEEKQVFETGIRQFRLALAMMGGWHLSPRNLEHMVADALKTLEEFGSPGDDVQQLLDGPFSDPKALKEYQVHMLQHTARHLQRFSPFYKRLLATHDLQPSQLKLEDMQRIPVTCKEDVQLHQREFITTNVQPYIATRTTGTTGAPTEIWLSKYEVEMWPALAALSGVLRNEINPADSMQVNISSRATAANQWNVGVCRLIGARLVILGIIPVEESLDNLLSDRETAPTILSTYPSYLAQLIKAARRRGLSPKNFRLRSIYLAGEVLSSSLKAAAYETLGPALVTDAYSMTEILPMGGRVCREGHLHFDLNVGYIEVIDPESGQPAQPGEIGSLVVTTYYPYRECMPVFRYDTRDLVRRLPDEPLTCELAAIPATSNILGKARHLLRLSGRYVAMRDLIEVYESLPSQPWPARLNAVVVDDHIEMIVAEEALQQGVTQALLERRYEEAGLPVRIVNSVAHEQEISRLRADLLETTFAARRND